VTIVSTIWQFWCSLIQAVTFSPKFSRSCAIVAEKTFTPLNRAVVWF
jgi:hypothetical protein